MSEWSFVSAHMEQWTGESWTTDPWTMAALSTRLIRSYFRISAQAPGTPYPPGNIDLQVDYGSGWESFGLGKLVLPYRTVGLAEFVGQDVLKYWQAQDYEGSFQLRAEVEWTGGPYYSDELTVTITKTGFIEVVPAQGGFLEGEDAVNANPWGENASVSNAVATTEAASVTNTVATTETASVTNANAWGEHVTVANANAWSEKEG